MSAHVERLRWHASSREHGGMCSGSSILHRCSGVVTTDVTSCQLATDDDGCAEALTRDEHGVECWASREARSACRSRARGRARYSRTQSGLPLEHMRRWAGVRMEETSPPVPFPYGRRVADSAGIRVVAAGRPAEVRDKGDMPLLARGMRRRLPILPESHMRAWSRSLGGVGAGPQDSASGRGGDSNFAAIGSEGAGGDGGA